MKANINKSEKQIQKSYMYDKMQKIQSKPIIKKYICKVCNQYDDFNQLNTHGNNLAQLNLP